MTRRGHGVRGRVGELTFTVGDEQLTVSGGHVVDVCSIDRVARWPLGSVHLSPIDPGSRA